VGKRSTILLLFLAAFGRLHAQYIAGKVVDQETGLPIALATLASGTVLAFTGADGLFTLSGIRLGDTISVTCIGYKRFQLAVGIQNRLIVRLEPISIVLDQVSVSALRDYRADSIRNRKEYAKVFNYQAPGLKDVFINRANTAYTPNTYNASPNNATQLVSVNLLAVMGLLAKNKAPESELQKILIRDEEATYVDHIFSKQKVMEITAMKGDSLQDFMAMYRPTIQQIKKMSGYDLITYIRKSYTEFLKTYRRETSPFRK